MEAATRRRSMGTIVRGAAAHPMAVATAVLVGLVVGLGVLWSLQLWGLPDVGDPFDVAAFQAQNIPDDQNNAFFWYKDAASMTSGLSRRLQAQKKDAVKFGDLQDDWSKVDTTWRDFLSQSGEALTLWKMGSEKLDARYDHPEGLSMRTLLPVSQELRMLGRLAVLEGYRIEAEGDMAGAWGWYRAALRSSRHSGMHGFLVERLIGAAMHDDASKALTHWASNPKVDAPLLRRALDDVIAIDAMTVPRSETLKMAYLLFVNSMADPNLIEDMLLTKNFIDDPDDWCQELQAPDAAKKSIQAARVLMANDYVRSLRLARLMTANWLAEVDKPPARRSKLARIDPPIYEPDPTAPLSSRALPPEKLLGWLDSSMLASRYYRGLNRYSAVIDGEWARRANLIVHLAGELYRREHGQAPSSPEVLVGPYLKTLPEGFDPTAKPKP